MRAEFDKDAGQNASLYDWKNFKTEALKREFMKVSDIGSAALKNKTKLERVRVEPTASSETIKLVDYFNAQCPDDFPSYVQCRHVIPALNAWAARA